jgi:hypothetical protein
LIHSSGTLYPSWKIEIFQEYLEDGLTESMKNSNLIHSDLSASDPSALSIFFFTLETKAMGVLIHRRRQRHQRKTTRMSFTLNISIIHFYSKLTLRDTVTILSRNLKNIRIFIGDEEFHQEPDHPCTFMKIVKERTRTMSAANDERYQVSP